MQSDHGRFERIGETVAVLGLLAGLALLTATLYLDRTLPGIRRFFADLARTSVLSEGDPMAPVVDSPPVVDIVQRSRSNRLFAHRKGARAVLRLWPGSTLAAGDLIQLGYTAGGATHGVIVSVDGRGVVTLHHPARPDETTALEPFGRQSLPYSFELDGEPTCERILFITANRPIDVGAVLAACRAMVAGSVSTRSLLDLG